MTSIKMRVLAHSFRQDVKARAGCATVERSISVVRPLACCAILANRRIGRTPDAGLFPALPLFRFQFSAEDSMLSFFIDPSI